MVFNTDTNHSVVQTYNLTTYKLCDYDDAQENDTIQWSSADPSNTASHPVSVEAITTASNARMASTLRSTSLMAKACQELTGTGRTESVPGPASGPQSGNDEDSVPETIVPSNFDHPHEDDTEEKNPSGSVALSIYATQGMFFTSNRLYTALDGERGNKDR
ncbi:early nodulin-like protein 18 [Prunus dulcis]|uniref:Early nodulin-like protein 18 n=1 Tax=Prunus dulcis TaxID=3755 RepID=A0A4Y1REH6_PRUDU|nr:early nodulin-like protein 18 [Prunus dulcis]